MGEPCALAPDRQAGAKDARDIAHHAVGHRRRDAALGHARAQDVAEDAGVRHAQGVDDGDAAPGIASMAARVDFGDDQDSASPNPRAPARSAR